MSKLKQTNPHLIVLEILSKIIGKGFVKVLQPGQGYERFNGFKVENTTPHKAYVLIILDDELGGQNGGDDGDTA